MPDTSGRNESSGQGGALDVATNIDRLLELAGPPLSKDSPRLPGQYAALADLPAGELLRLLGKRNGFYAFESALLVRPLSEQPNELGIVRWNAPALWRSEYQGLADGPLFFAEDIFGGQFGVAADAVFWFNPETGDRERLTSSVEDWAGLLLKDSSLRLGWPLAHEWQQRFGPLPEGKRLVPKVPFVLGGDFEVANLHALDAVRAMRFYANVAVQIHNASDGTKIQLRVIE